jgi:glycosyltransferase involved in cell wall biosynthesis
MRNGAYNNLSCSEGVDVARKLKITFVLPGRGDVPVGGPKVVYEYANHLSRKGHIVSVVHPARSCSYGLGYLGQAMNWIRYVQIILGKPFRPDRWFQIDPGVNMLCTPDLSERWIPNGDAVIATAWQTAEWVSRYPANKGRGFYLIQGFEAWNTTAETVYATWKAPLRKIVIAKWLLDIAKRLGEEAVYIPNGLSANEFQMDIQPAERDPMRIMMLYHNAKGKGSAQGIEAIMEARQKVPGIKATLFGVPPRPASLPEWIEYHQQPERGFLRTLYNKAAIFVAPSWAEGWPLPPAEAMLCGAALAVTDIGGHQEYAFHNETALLSPAKDAHRLADNILRLVRDPALRVHLAMQGHKHIQQYTWSRATDAFETVLLAGMRDDGASI